MKKKNVRRCVGIFMLTLIAIFAIALIVVGGCIFKFVIFDKQFWFDLSGFSLLAQNGIMLFTGYIGGFGAIGIGIGIILNLIGYDNLKKIFGIQD